MLLKKFGKYEIKDWLGGGRFGDVFLARDTLLDRDFALKICRMREEEINMLMDEAKLLAALNHANIVRFYNIDNIEGKFVLVMEYIKGKSLREMIQDQGIEIALIISMTQQMLDALGYAHGIGVLHRDLKPENILLDGDGKIEITDFGLARFIKSGSISASTAGTPIYMAPESWSGNFATKSDVWSLGVILYELLTGTPPFLDDSLDGLRKKIKAGKILTPSILRPKIPDFLEAITIQCLSADPGARPEIAEILKKFQKVNRGIRIETDIPTVESAHRPLTLTADQRDIIDSVEGKVLVLGQAGCGKTTTMTSAVLRLIEKGVPLQHILICTFTNRAADELKNRLEKSTTASCHDHWIGTFHSLCHRILRRDAERLDISDEFTVLDPKAIFARLAMKTGRYRANAALRFIEMLKAKGVGAGQFNPENEWEAVCSQVYRNYTDYTQANNILDFDDLILLTTKLLAENSDLKEFYQCLFEYVFVDELQDANRAQYTLVSHLIRDRVFFTGDADQAIYGWRGAERELVYRAAQDHPNIRIFNLAKSFRLPQTMVDAANNLLLRSATIVPNLETGEVFVYGAKSEEDEATYVISELKTLLEGGFNYRDCAVLYRMNYLSRVYEDKFLRAQVPYLVVTGSYFKENKEIKSVIDYLELLAEHESDLSAEDFAARATACLKIDRHFVDQARQLFLYHWQNRTRIAAGTLIEELTSFIPQRGDIFDELKGLARKCSDPGVKKFLSELRLLQELDLVDWTKDAVRLMTIHSAKGLEFPVVFLVDLVEDIFPMTKTMMVEHELAEERRLCYVAVTRAQKKLYLIYPKYRQGRLQNPSRFLIDMFKKRT